MSAEPEHEHQWMTVYDDNMAEQAVTLMLCAGCRAVTVMLDDTGIEIEPREDHLAIYVDTPPKGT